MPSKKANVKNEKQYEALKDKGMSKERAESMSTQGLTNEPHDRPLRALVVARLLGRKR